MKESNKEVHEPSEVIMVEKEGSPVNVRFTQRINYFTRLGREVKISPKANITVNSPGFKIEFFVETVSVCIGIGKDFSADLIMTKDAWEALNQGEKIHITTTEEFKKKFL